MTKPIDIISRALKDIGALEAGEQPTADAAQDAFDMMNDLIDQWSNEDMMVFNITEIIFPVIAGQVQYTILHKAGDVKLDANGDPVYLHRVGEFVLDNNGNKIPVNASGVVLFSDFLLIDGKYGFATEASYTAYLKEITALVAEWCTDTLSYVNQPTLEKTSVYYYPKKSSGNIS